MPHRSVVPVLLVLAVVIAMDSTVLGAPRRYRLKRDSRDIDIYRNNVIRCSPGMTCGWALCDWVRTSYIPRRSCDIIEHLCRCPQSQSCVASDMVEPSSTHLTIHYKCRRSESVVLAV